MDEGDQSGAERSSDSSSIHVQRTDDWSATKPSIAVINALATVKNVDPAELTTECGITLYDYVDPEALDVLVRNQRSEQAIVSFAIDRYQIRFESDELIVCSRDR
ncbi:MULTISPECIES: HalOD1 output domain-containing protein [Natrialbaceae]|uniref:HalOD1 output domain-containing protein n=1 Tax=Natrialbaceae TaxID=1644061 RepID=UPI00207CAB35|nr:HalOD1 output domain-containing protein [Natronococcus sp. CG52]